MAVLPPSVGRRGPDVISPEADFRVGLRLHLRVETPRHVMRRCMTVPMFSNSPGSGGPTKAGAE
jgi:hypothetical protein